MHSEDEAMVPSLHDRVRSELGRSGYESWKLLVAGDSAKDGGQRSEHESQSARHPARAAHRRPSIRDRARNRPRHIQAVAIPWIFNAERAAFAVRPPG